jgi:hypothetical protein
MRIKASGGSIKCTSGAETDWTHLGNKSFFISFPVSVYIVFVLDLVATQGYYIGSTVLE